jgi:hypothetical protein
MAATRMIVVTAIGLAIAGCNQPVPEYSVVKIPPSYRTAPDGLRIDNENYALDAEGYRLNTRGERIGMIDVPAKMDKDLKSTSNAVAGYYISSTGAAAPGSIAAPSEGAGTGVGAGPGAVTPMPSGGGTTPPPTTR